jgi:hypothetical protein
MDLMEMPAMEVVAVCLQHSHYQLVVELEELEVEGIAVAVTLDLLLVLQVLEVLEQLLLVVVAV